MTHLQLARNWTMYLIVVGGVLVGASALLASCDVAHASVNMEAIKQIESSGNPRAYNRGSQARGLYQITPICLKHYNQMHKVVYKEAELFDPTINFIVARWYFHWLQTNYGLDDVEAIIGFNAGPRRALNYRRGVVDLPQETQDYLTKYQLLTNE